MAYQKNDKKRALLAFKEEILKDIKQYEKRIEDARSHKTNSSYFDDDADSDSDILTMDMGPSVTDLKLEQSHLQTCLHATQELTNLCVLQSEINIMVNDPVYEREPPVSEQGVWREVTADCRVDLVPFSVTFYIHQSSRLFGPTSYRGLRVLPVKAAHENELAKSMLPRVNTPSDAVEVLRSYAVAHRSRRTTLARLAEKYSNSLFMEPMAEGGYIIKCANLLEVSWTLENKWSPVAPFHHRMKFDLEYMDEMYVKIISQAHRELSDPTLETDERTRLMSKIIATCLEAQGPTQELYESMESDIESENLRKRRTTLDEEIEEPINKKKKDSEIMAPPKSLPKKTKPRGKENNAGNNKDPKSVKRTIIDDGNENAKKVKLGQDSSTTKNINTNNKNNKVKEVAGLQKIIDNKGNNVKDNAIKTNVDKEVMRSKSDKEKNISNLKKSNKDNVMKNFDDLTKNHGNKENIVTVKKIPDNKTDNFKNNIGNTKQGSVKNNVASAKSGTDNSENVRESATSKKNVDKQNLKGKSIKEKRAGDTDNSNNPVNIEKSNKKLDIIPKVDNDKKDKLNKMPKSGEKMNDDKTKKNASTKSQNVEVNQKNNENLQKSKVSSTQPNISNKQVHLNTFSKDTDNQNNPRVKSTGTMKKNDACIHDDLSINNKINKKSDKTKSVEKLANLKVRNSGNVNTKNIINSDEKNVEINPRDKKIKNKLQELNENLKKTQPSTKRSKNEIDSEEIGISKTSNKQIIGKESTKPKESNTNSKVSNKHAKSNVNVEKSVDIRSSADMQRGVNQVKMGAKNINPKSKNKEKLTEKVDKINIVTEKKDSNFKKTVKNNVVRVNNKFFRDVNQRNSAEINKNNDLSPLKERFSTKQQTVDVNDDSATNKLIKSNLKVKNNAQNIINNKITRSSKSPIHKNSLKQLNHRNKISMEKLKENDLQKVNKEKNMMFTKIPQKFVSVREQIVKKNPMRVSPRRIQSKLITDSQNSSRSSQRSLQKPMTGIPRLMKKPIRKV